MKSTNLPLQIAVVVAQFNNLVTDRLVDGALTTLAERGIAESQVAIFKVPGAFEIPRLTQQLANHHQFNGVITLGAVIKGQTDHYQFISDAVTQQLAAIAAHSEVPVTFGLLTTSNIEQALNRAGGKAGNKGSECAAALLTLIDLDARIAAIPSLSFE